MRDVPTEDLSVEQRELVNENLAAAGRYLDSLVEMMEEHRRDCSDRACCDGQFSDAVADLPDHSVRQVLWVAVERLAAIEVTGDG